MKLVISKVQESVMALNDLLHSNIYKKKWFKCQKKYLKYNYFWPIGGAVTKLIENCHGIVAQNKEKYLISVGQSIVSVVNLLQVQ